MAQLAQQCPQKKEHPSVTAKQHWVIAKDANTMQMKLQRGRHCAVLQHTAQKHSCEGTWATSKSVEPWVSSWISRVNPINGSSQHDKNCYRVAYKPISKKMVQMVQSGLVYIWRLCFWCTQAVIQPNLLITMLICHQSPSAIISYCYKWTIQQC